MSSCPVGSHRTAWYGAGAQDRVCFVKTEATVWEMHQHCHLCPGPLDNRAGPAACSPLHPWSPYTGPGAGQHATNAREINCQTGLILGW